MLRLATFIVWLLTLSVPVFAQDEGHLIKVQGTGREMVAADVAEVRLAVEVNTRTAKTTQIEIAERMAPLLTVLRDQGAEQVETGNLYIYPEYSKGEPRVITGYRGTQEVHFEAKVEAAGSLIDLGIANGANRIQSVQVRPDRALLNEARSRAIRAAAQNAVQEARLVLGELGLEEKGVYRIQIGSEGNHYPVYRSKSLAFESTADFSTEITGQEQEVTAQVSLEIKFDN